jgi:hypothetical protein
LLSRGKIEISERVKIIVDPFSFSLAPFCLCHPVSIKFDLLSLDLHQLNHPLNIDYQD